MSRSGPIRLLATAFMAVALIACGRSPTVEATGEYLDDSVITPRVEAAPHQEPVVSGQPFKGVVRLSGFVTAATGRGRAAEPARGIAGAKQIRNGILIR